MQAIEALEPRTLFSAQAMPVHRESHSKHHIADLIAKAAATHNISSIRFSNYTWTVRSGSGGPGPNLWSNNTSSVSVDSEGRLHILVSKINGTWYSSEVYLPHSLGYGTYQFDVASRVDLTDRNLTAAGFLYASDTNEYDIEFSKWGDATSPTNTDFTTQPSDAPNAIDNWHETLKPGLSTYKIIWSPGKVEFTASQGSKILQDWSYTGPNTFSPGGEVFHFNHWINTAGQPASGKAEDFIVQDFKFTK